MMIGLNMQKTIKKLDDELPLKKSIKFFLMTITIKCVFKEDNKLYPQIFLDDTLYEL